MFPLVQSLNEWRKTKVTTATNKIKLCIIISQWELTLKLRKLLEARETQVIKSRVFWTNHITKL